MKRLYIIFLAGILAVLFISCQAVFTTSPLAGFQREMTALSADAKLTYAEDLLASGSQEELAAAYAIIDELAAASDDPEISLLAVDLAIAASGLEDVMLDALAALGGGDVGEDDAGGFLDSLEDLDTDMLGAAVDHLENAEGLEGADIAPDQYINAAAAQLLVVAKDEGGMENIDWENDPDVAQAIDWAELGGLDLEAIFAGF